MNEDFDEKPAEALDLKRYVAVLRRRVWYFLGPLFFGWLLVWGISWTLSPVYKSSTTILVEQPTVPKDYVMPNVSDDLQDRLQSIQQQILSRTRLLRIIDQLNLYPKERAKRTPDELVERMRKNIGVSLNRDELRQVNAFEVSFLDGSPEVAQKVTTELTNLFITENLETRQQQSADTTNFLASQLEQARKTLAEQELKVREFKDRHPGELPTQLQSNIQILTGIQSQLQNEQDALNTAKQQNVYLESLLAQYHAMQKNGTPGTTPPPSGLTTTIDQELAREQAQLNELRSHDTDQHPDVRKMREQIARTQKTRDQLLAQARASAGETGAAGTDGEGKDSPLLQLQGQLRANQMEIANRERSVADLQAKAGQYQSHLSQEPVIEQQFTDLTRGYEQSKNNYDELLKKENASQMATSMELRQQGEHFSVLDAPSLPLKPDFPNRLKLCGIGLGIGLALGILSVATAEYLDDRLYEEATLKKLLPVAVLAEIPPMATPAELAEQQKRVRLQWAAAAVAGAVILAGSALSYLQG